MIVDSQTLTLVGMVVQILITIGGFIKFIVSFERRMTAVETRLQCLAMKRYPDDTEPLL